MKKRVTLQQIAEACETSVGTVSRAINGKSDINSETRNEILRVAKELGYNPEKLQEYGKIHRICVVYSEYSKYFYDEVSRGIQAAAEKWKDAGIRVETFQTKFLEQESQSLLLHSLKIEDYDAFIIESAGRDTGEFILNLRSAGIPVVTFLTDAPNSNRLFYIGSDPFAAGCLAAGLLGQLLNGHGKVVLYGSLDTNESIKERFSGFCTILNHEFPDIELVPILKYCESEIETQKSLTKLLEEDASITAILTSNTT